MIQQKHLNLGSDHLSSLLHRRDGRATKLSRRKMTFLNLSLFLFADSSLLLGELDQLLVDGEALVPPNVVHVLPGDVFRVGLVTEVEQLFLGARHPERVHLNDLPVAEHQLRHGQTGSLFPVEKNSQTITNRTNTCH